MNYSRSVKFYEKKDRLIMQENVQPIDLKAIIRL